MLLAKTNPCQPVDQIINYTFPAFSLSFGLQLDATDTMKILVVAEIVMIVIGDVKAREADLQSIQKEFNQTDILESIQKIFNQRDTDSNGFIDHVN